MPWEVKSVSFRNSLVKKGKPTTATLVFFCSFTAFIVTRFDENV